MDVRFTFERLLLRGLHYRLMFAAAIIVAVSICAGLLVVLLDPKFDDTGAGVWWSFLRLSDPGYLGDDEGAVSVTISTVLTVLGYVLFLGLLVAILTQWMNGLIARVESGATRIRFKNHVLILGWNYRTPSIVLELLETKGRTLRFLEDSGARQLRIVILAEHVDAELRDELRSSLGERWDDRRVVLRSGSPLKLDGLERVAFHDAAAVILPGADFATALPGVADAEIVKTLAAISGTGEGGAKPPLAVAALFNANRSEVARRAYNGDLEVIAADQLVSRLVAQTIQQPGLWAVYWELLSLLEDNTVFVRTVAGEHAVTIAEARDRCPNAVVVGIIPTASRKPMLNPPADMQTAPGDSLIFIAKHFADCAFSAPGNEPAPAQMPDWRPVTSNVSSVLILGWSRNVPKVLAELLAYQQQAIRIDVAGITPIEERKVSIDSVVRAQKTGIVSQIECNFLDPDAAAELHPESYDAVLMIARDRLGDEAVADAATFSGYLTIEGVLTGTSRPHLVAELLDEENASLFDRERVDVIVSPMIVSYILSQVALEPELGLVVHELTRSTGTKILFRSLESDAHDGACSFADISEHAAARGETAIGVVSSTDGARKTQLNPGANARWDYKNIDRVIVLGPVPKVR